MTEKLKVLITNHNFAQRAGTQLYIRDLALELQKMGHLPFIYSPVVGEVAQELRKATIPIVSDLAMLSIQPDIIHGHHHLETLSALLHFPKTPALFICHGWYCWQESPPKFPRILRYVAVDQLTYNRIVMESGIPKTDVRLIFNFTDLDRFKLRPSLPIRPRKALIYSNYIEKNGSCFKTVQEACQKIGVEVDLIGLTAGNAIDNPEKILINYDLVFAVGRSAIEALATGAAVVIYSGNKIGPMVTSANFDQLQKMNFGLQALDRLASVEAILEELNHYNPTDMKKIHHALSLSSNKDAAVKALVDLYREIIEIPYEPNIEKEMRAIGHYLHQFSKEFQCTMQQLLADRQRVSHLIEWYERFLKLPFLGPTCKALKRMIVGSH